MSKSLGTIGFRPRGAWKPNERYRKDDMITKGRSSLYAKEDHVSGEEFDPSLWGYIVNADGVEEAAVRAEAAAELAETNGTEAGIQAEAAKEAAKEAKEQTEAAKEATGIFTENFMHFTNDEFVYGIVDKYGTLLWGIRSDGSCYQPKGIPEEVKKRFDELAGLQIMENEHFLFAITDKQNNVLFGITKTGATYVNSINGIVVVEECDDENFIYSVTDSKNNLLFGIKHDGTFCMSKFELPNDLKKKLSCLQELNDKEFIHVMTDSTGKILFGIRFDGSIYIPKGTPEDVKKAIAQFTKRVDNVEERTSQVEERIKDYTENNNKSISKVMYNGNQGRAYLGNVTLQEPGKTDYCILMMYGQSLSNGSENPAGFDDPVVEGCYMLGNNVWSTSGDTLNPLKVGGTVREDGVATGTRQDTIVSTVNSFVTLYHKERPWDKNTKFIACSLGVGGRTVAQLSGCKYREGDQVTKRYPTCNEYNLDIRVKPFFEAVKAIADKEGKTISLSAVFWKQGESDYGTGHIGKTYDQWKTVVDGNSGKTSCSMSGCRDAYYKGLTILKEDIFALAKQIFGEDQAARPVFMPYSVCGTYINNAYMTINDATSQMADDQDDVIQVGPTYVTPDYNGGHLSMNGYRWFGEYCAKALYHVYLKGINWRPMQPYNFEVSGNKIYIYINPIVPPLRFDKYTLDNAYKDNGFIVRNGSVAELDSNKSASQLNVKITDISIIENCVVLTCGEVESFTGAVEVIYAGQGASGYSGHNQGAGNLRDSDTWIPLYSYRQDSADHGSKNANWSSPITATDEDLSTLQYWDANYASQTKYSKGDKVLYNIIENVKPVVLESLEDNNASRPYNPVNYHPQDVKGAVIVGKKYPMQNWCLNFYKRIVLG